MNVRNLTFAALFVALVGCHSVPGMSDPNRPSICTISGTTDDAVKASVITPLDTGEAAQLDARAAAVPVQWTLAGWRQQVK
jgi:hypothetical protein